MRYSLVMGLGLAMILSIGCASKAKKPDAQTAAPQKTSAPAAAAKTETTTTYAGIMGVTCKKGEETRVIEIKQKGEGCEVMYTKGGQTNSVASGRSGNTHCENTLNKMKGKLTSGGYSCS